MYGIILAGGSGSRLWPLSRELYPKQFLSIDNNETLLQSTFDRLAVLMDVQNIFAIANKKHATDVFIQLNKKVSGGVVLAEPTSKNTAPAIAVGLQYLSQKTSGDEIVLIVPSDHLIEDIEGYKKSIEQAKILAEEGYIVTLGIKPQYPETGYGYIKTADSLNVGFKVDKFVEKPDKNTAIKYIEEGNYYWNSGMFLAKLSVLHQEFERHSADIYACSLDLDFSNSLNIPQELYEKMESISFDYAIMEKSDKIALVELRSDWSDIGSFQSLYNAKPKDKDGNVLQGNIITDDVKNSFIYGSKKLVAVSGIEDVVVVDTEDAVLVCKKENSQNVKDIYNQLKEKNDSAHLVHKTVFRPWGYYTCIESGKGYLTKVISVSSGQKLSIQSHNHRAEHWVVLQGKAKVLMGEEFLTLNVGQSVDIGVGVIHSLQNPYDEELKIIEVQQGDYLAEDDIIRYEDIYGRV